MSKNVAMFVDVANMYYAARGQDVDVDYVALLKHATKGRDLIRAYAYTGLDPENENQRKFIDFLGKNGYKPVVKDIRKFGDGRMKANLDIELVVDLFRLADRMDIAVIVSGDGDFAPAIKALQDKGVRCEVISFKPNTSSDLMAVADEFMDIMKVASISRKEGRVIRETGMSAPEMPAKEVTPEFGFREASPTVAAAALAALKGGGSEAGRRGRATTSRRPAAASAAAAPAEAATPAATTAVEGAADADPEARRRRRRRGGRGRGRTRRDDETAPAAESGSEEIGWEEFDDLSQLDGSAAEREYTFEDADAATLAELGLSAEDNVGLATPATEEAATDEAPKPTRRRSTRSSREATPAAAEAATDEAPKPTRRRSTRSSREATPATDEAATDEAPKPTRRRSTRSSRDATPATDEAATDEAPKPTRRRSTRSSREGSTAADTATASEADGEPQGIWGRFRTARKPRGTAG
ncbi:MAG TPA: NYN domain-containing protein [Candidatus Limnocylindrales bacterium]|nr:NYN domain-containing protein [Candidatus Limnocylindrales bacterium]